MYLGLSAKIHAGNVIRRIECSPALRKVIKPTSTPIFSRTMSFKTFLSTSKGVAPCKAASALRSFFRSACSISQFHCRGGRCGGAEALAARDSSSLGFKSKKKVDIKKKKKLTWSDEMPFQWARDGGGGSQRSINKCKHQGQ